MAVYDIAREMADSPEGDFEAGKYTVRRHFLVKVTDINDGPQIVCSATGLPILLSIYQTPNESNPYMRARRYEARRLLNAGLAWKVTVIYETPPVKDGSGSGGGEGSTGGGTGTEKDGEFLNPLLETPTVKFHASGREVLLTRVWNAAAKDWQPCTASNGQVFDPPPKTLEPCATLEITRNESIASNQPGIALTYQNAVNSDPFWGQPAGIWKVKEIVPERQERQIPGGPPFPFLRVSYTFEANPNGWQLQLLDYGDYYWAPGKTPTSPATRTCIETTKGQPTAGCLNGKGGALPDRLPFTFAGADITIPFTSNNTRFNDKQQVFFANVGGALPSPLQSNTAYYVKNPGNSVTFTVAATPPGGVVQLDVTLSGGSGTQFIYAAGVFIPVNCYKSLPYAQLSLPQNFAFVQ